MKTLDASVSVTSKQDLHEHSPNNILKKDCEDPKSTSSAGFNPTGKDCGVLDIHMMPKRQKILYPEVLEPKLDGDSALLSQLSLKSFSLEMIGVIYSKRTMKREDPLQGPVVSGPG